MRDNGFGGVFLMNMYFARRRLPASASAPLLSSLLPSPQINKPQETPSSSFVSETLYQLGNVSGSPRAQTGRSLLCCVASVRDA